MVTSRKGRFLTIIQLCFVFSTLLGYVADPFFGEYFALRNRMLLYEFVMGHTPAMKERFIQLSPQEQLKVSQGYEKFKLIANRPFFEKLSKGMHDLMTKVGIFEQAWIFFSIVICILILLDCEGAHAATWILFLLVILHAFDNQFTGHLRSPSADQHLFPSEDLIIAEYIKEKKLSSSIVEQQKQLQEGWEQYLLLNWSLDEEKKSNVERLEDAQFAFTLQRLRLLEEEKDEIWLHRCNERKGVFSLVVLLFWSGFFAWKINVSDVKLSRRANPIFLKTQN